MNLDLVPLLRLLQSWPPEAIWLMEMFACYSCVVLLHRFFGLYGLYTHIVLGVIGANIEVLKAVKFSVFPDPVGMGTILFASTYMATDLLSERYGTKAAHRGIMLGFAALLAHNIFMFLNLAFQPLTKEIIAKLPEAKQANALFYVDMQGHMEAILLPGVGFFLAGMCAYLISQFNDVWIFQRLRARTGGKYLWLRNGGSNVVSGLVDNTIFSVLAWIVFTPNPLPWSTVLWTYILGTYWLRLGVALLDTPFVYLARLWKPKDEHGVPTVTNTPPPPSPPTTGVPQFG
jgi:uncharacterized integral membrane protein (TIGR00697 family)